jgi:CubicO group peptidase (beta-lactamase class C family)
MLISLLTHGCPDSSERTGEDDVVVPWWSFTKTVLAVAAMTLVRDGLIKLDDAVPEWPFTLRQLLRHQSGLADYGELPEYHAAVTAGEPSWPVEEMLQRLQATRLRYRPGEGWRYSNVGYLLVSQLVERVTDLPLSQALAQRVFSASGISSAQLLRHYGVEQSGCIGIKDGYDPGWVYHGLIAGPLCEAARLLDHLLNGKLIPPKLLDEMQATVSLGGPIAGRPWLTPGYAAGLMRGGVAGGLTLCGHTGAGPGSVVAIYNGSLGEASATCAVFCEDSSEGKVETEAVLQLTKALGLND